MSGHIEEGSWDDFGAGDCPKFPDSPKVQYAAGWLKIPGVAAVKIPDARGLTFGINPGTGRAEIRQHAKILIRGGPDVLNFWNQMLRLFPPHLGHLLTDFDFP